MSQAVNPNTNVPMSLQVEKIQQLRNVHDMQQQGQLAQKSDLEKKREQQRVNANTETDEARIRNNKDSNSNDSRKENDRDNGEDDHSSKESEQLELTGLEKGRIFDVSI